MVELFVAYSLFAGISGKVQGIVLNGTTGEPISYADVIIAGTEQGAATNEDGTFFILDVLPGIYTIEVSCIGYQSMLIKEVSVEVDITTRLTVELEESAIEIAPVTVTGELSPVKKDMVGTTYIVRKKELKMLPVDYDVKLVMFQAAVAHIDTALHVRGGRATEVQYMIDNVPILDPQTGDPAIYISRGVVDEIIFLPGGFDVEYGRALSGVVNLITTFPSDHVGIKAYTKTESIMPFYYNFGYYTYQGTAQLPVSKKCKGYIALDMMHTDDWNPRLYILPHKQRDDYSLYGKLFLAPLKNVKIIVNAAQSRTQFDRYNTQWMYNLDHYRSDMRKGNIEAVNITYLPKPQSFFNIVISRLYSHKQHGVRTTESGNPFTDYQFQQYTTLRWPLGSTNNPYGVYVPFIPTSGDYPEYQNKTSLIMRANMNSIIQLNKHHEIKAGFEYADQTFNNFTYWVSDSLHPLVDEYEYTPREYSIYLQDNIDFKGLYAKLGCRFDYFTKDPSSVIVAISGSDTLDLDTTEVQIDPTIAVSPRIGLSFMVTENFLFRTNIGRYVQPPLYDYMYSNFNVMPFPSYITDPPVIGNPYLKPEKTISYEIGLQGKISETFDLTVNSFYKDVSDLTGIDTIRYDRLYLTYNNIEYANIKGIEIILETANSTISGKISYTLSWARGTSSFATEYADTGNTRPAVDYYLDFDQRHRFFIQGTVNLPFHSQLYIFGYFGSGFPYTPPGEEGKTEDRNALRWIFQRMVDCVVSKPFSFGPLSINTHIEIINILDERYEIAPHYPLISLESIKPWNFNEYIAINSSYYHPAADVNHDGLITPKEEYQAFHDLVESTDDWINAYTSPRRARLGIEITF